MLMTPLEPEDLSGSRGDITKQLQVELLGDADVNTVLPVRAELQK